MRRKRKKKTQPSRKPYKKHKSVNGKRHGRDYQSPHYRKWRDDIKKRDGYTCQWPGCSSRSSLQVHHIKTWAKYPALRFVMANGITLCRKCHEDVKGKEADFEGFFLKLLEWSCLDKLKKYNKKNGR